MTRRDHTIQIRMTQDELAEAKRLAGGVPLSKWMRAMMSRSAPTLMDLLRVEQEKGGDDPGRMAAIAYLLAKERG